MAYSSSSSLANTKWFSAKKIALMMGVLCCAVGLCLFLVLRGRSHKRAISQSAQFQVALEGTLHINGSAPIASTDKNFICATLDWWPPNKCDDGVCSWGNASLLNLDLNNQILLNAVKAFAGLTVRLGGTLQDIVTYESGDGRPCYPFVKNDSHMFGFSHGCLPMSRWDELNNFFRKTGAQVVFGLNALSGKIMDSDGSAMGAWDSTNAESLIRYTFEKGYEIHGWELGNELCGKGIGARVAADQYASDVDSLKDMVDKIYGNCNTSCPMILAPGGFFDPKWFKEFSEKTRRPQNLQAVTHHIYNLGSGGTDDQLIEKILDPSCLNGGSYQFRSLQSTLVNSRTPSVAWVSEAGGVPHSGRYLVTNTFVFSFWYLDQLGMASSYNTKTYCRQTLIGGNYGLLNTNTFAPNPDYYSALLWNRLMGKNVLSTRFIGTKKMRAYTHCARSSHGIAVLLLNLDSNATVRVQISPRGLAMNKTFARHKYESRKPEFVWIHKREEYHLTAENGDLQSQTMLLNGKMLALDSSGNIPRTKPAIVMSTTPIVVAPFSIVFIHIPSFTATACR